MSFLHSLIDGLTFLLIASIAGSILAVFVWVIHRICPRVVTPRLAYLLWGLVALRLMMPVCPESPYSFLNLIPDFGASQTASDESLLPEFTATIRYIDGEPAAQMVDAQLPMGVTGLGTTDSIGAIRLVCTLAWLSVASVFLVVVLVRMRETVRLIRSADFDRLPDWLQKLNRDCAQSVGLRRPVPLGLTQSLAVPAVAGFLRPRVLLPNWCLEEMTTEQIRLVLTHELVHARRHDVAVQFVVLLVRILHWFNPLAALMQRRIIQLHEIRCDQEVIRLNGNHRAIVREYGNTLLQIASRYCESDKQKQHVTGFTANGLVGAVQSQIHKSCLHERIHMLTQRKTRSWSVGLLVTVVISGFVLCGFTAAQTDEKKSAVTATAEPLLLLPPMHQDDDLQYYPQGPEFKLAAESAALKAARQDAEIQKSFDELEGLWLPPAANAGESLPLVELPVERGNIVRANIEDQNWGVPNGTGQLIINRIEIYEGGVNTVAGFLTKFMDTNNNLEENLEGKTFELAEYDPGKAADAVRASSLTLLSAPKLTSIMGHGAQILMGREIPFTDIRIDEDGHTVPDVKLVQDGFRMKITNQLTDDGQLVANVDVTDSRVTGSIDKKVDSDVGELVVMTPIIECSELQTTIRMNNKSSYGLVINAVQDNPDDPPRVRLIVITPELLKAEK